MGGEGQDEGAGRRDEVKRESNNDDVIDLIQ